MSVFYDQFQNLLWPRTSSFQDLYASSLTRSLFFPGFPAVCDVTRRDSTNTRSSESAAIAKDEFHEKEHMAPSIYI